MSARVLLSITGAATAAQIAMVAVGHASPAVAGMFAIGGMALSLLSRA